MIRAYLRASTTEQDANRARAELQAFADKHGQPVASWYTENASGASADRSELQRLLDDANQGDVLLVEAIDRLSRLTAADWAKLRSEITTRQLRIVALDLPTSHAALQASSGDEFTGRMLEAINLMLIDICAAAARRDYELRRHRQAQGIAKAKAEGRIRGRQIDHKKHQRIIEALEKGCSVREAAKIVGCSTNTVLKAKRLAA